MRAACVAVEVEEGLVRLKVCVGKGKVWRQPEGGLGRERPQLNGKRGVHQSSLVLSLRLSECWW